MNRYEPKYFKYTEFDSPDSPGSGVNIDDKLLIILDIIRLKYGKPITVNSGYRTKIHNEAVGGVPNSQHRLGKAADLHIPNQKTGDLFEKIAKENGAKGIGRYNSFIHVDTRETEQIAEWDLRTS